jgi:hypothetical protein
MAEKAVEPAGMESRHYLSPLEFSQLSGLSLATVHRYLRNGNLPFWQPAGPRSRILVPIDALNTLSGSTPAAQRAIGATVAENRPQVPTASAGPARLPGPRPKWSRQEGYRL